MFAFRKFLVRRAIFRKVITSLRQNLSKPVTIQSKTLETISENPHFATESSQTNTDLSRTLQQLLDKKKLGISLKTLNSFDEQLSSQVTSNLQLTDVLHTMHCCALVSQTGASKMEVFRKCLEFIDSYYSRSDSNVFHKVQAFYYVSFFRDAHASKTLVGKLLKKLDPEELRPLSLFEMSLFCSALFSCSVPIQNKEILRLIVEKIQGDVTILRNSPILISLIKALRISNYHSLELCDTLAQNPQALSSSHHSLVGRIHLSVYLASCLYANTYFVEDIVSSCLLDSESEQLRLKDVRNLTWVIASFCDSNINEAVSRSALPAKVSSLIGEGRHSCDFAMTVTLILHLWIAGVRLEKEVVEHVNDVNLKAMRGKAFFKDVSNVNLLLSCVAIEAPDLLRINPQSYQDHRLSPKFEKHLAQRPEFRRVWMVLQDNLNALGLKDFRFSYQIPGLYVGGVTAKYKNTLINIEVIDNHACLANSSLLNGRMILKLRLLEKLGNPIIKVPSGLSRDSIVTSLRKELARY